MAQDPNAAANDDEKNKGEFKEQNFDVQLSFDYNMDPVAVPPKDEAKIRYVMQSIQNLATYHLEKKGKDFKHNSDAWIEYFSKFPLVFNFASRRTVKKDFKDFSLSTNGELIGSLVDAKAPQDVKDDLVAAIKKSGGELAKTSDEKQSVQYLSLIRVYGKASRLVIYKAQLDKDVKTIKTVCASAQKMDIKVLYDQVDFEINNQLAIGLQKPILDKTIKEVFPEIVKMFVVIAKESVDDFNAWLDGLGK